MAKENGNLWTEGRIGGRNGSRRRNGGYLASWDNIALLNLEESLPWTNWWESQHGELTDRGRETTFALGQRLRHLYVDQLGFMPKIKSDTEDMYLRATPIPRALESLQQTFWGMYPASARTADFPPPVIVGRSVSDETLFPNEGSCRRFRHLARLFEQRAAERCTRIFFSEVKLGWRTNILD